jgi:hypothetical protein
VALRALLRVQERHPDAIYVVAGKESPGLNLERQVRMLGLDDAVRRLGYIDEATVPDLLAAADLVVNLRFPTAGETSASLLRILAAGQAVIVSRAGAMAQLDPALCALVAPDAIEEELLATIINQLLEEPPLRLAMGRQARAHIESQHTLAHSAAAYLRVLDPLLGGSPPVQVWPEVIVDARSGGPALVDGRQTSVEVSDDPLADAVATAIVELRLDRCGGLVRSAGALLAELGLDRPRAVADWPGSPAPPLASL